MQRNSSLNRSRLFQQPFLITLLLVITLDQVSKFWVRSALSAGQSLPEGGLLRLTHLTNSGAAWGLFAQQTLALILCTLAAILALFLCYRYLPLNQPLARIGLALALGGGIGNLVDRIWFGYVIDFIDFHWVTFNFADAAIVVGAGIVVYSLVKRKCLKNSVL